MARLWTCGFETGQAEWNSGSQYTYWKTDPLRTGTRCLSLIDAAARTRWFSHVLPADQTKLYFRFAIVFNNDCAYYGQQSFLTIYDADNNVQMTFDFVDGAQVIRLVVGGVPVKTGGLTLAVDTWYVMEVYIHCDTSGTVTLKINNTTDFTYSGDTDPQDTGAMRRFRFLGSGAYIGIYLDDIAVNNDEGTYQTSYAGLGGVYYLTPNGEGATAMWTPSAGTVNYELVDEVPRNTTDWVQAVDSGSLDLYELSDSPSYVSVINMVQVLYSAAVTESGYNELMDVIRHDSVNYADGTATVVTVAPTYLLYSGTAHYVQPNGSGAWGTAHIDALQAGIQVV